MCSSTANGESLSTATSNLAQPLAKIRRFARRIIYLLLFIAPLLYAPGLPLANPFDTGRRLFLLLCTGLLCACLLQSWEQCKQFTLRKHVLDIPVLLFSLAILVTGFTSAYPWISLFGPVWSKDGLPLLGSCLVLYFAIKEFIVDPREISFALNITVFSGGLVALIGLTEYFGILNFHLPYSQYRLMSTLGNPMFTGTYLATLIPLGFGLIFACPHPRLKLWLDASTLVMLVALLFTLTRGAWVAVCCAFLLMSVLVICQRKRLFPSPASVWGLWIRFAIYAFVLVIMLTAQSRLSVKSAESLAVQSRLSSMTHLQSENTVTDRLLAIKGGVRMFLARPLFGWGLGTSSFVMPEFRPVGSQSRYAIQSYPHCLPVQIAAETGILGLLPYLLLLVLLFYTAYKITCRDGEFAWLGIGLLGLFTANFVASLGAVDDAETLMLFWAMLGITASLQAKEAVLSTTSEAKAMPAFGRYLCHYGALLALLLTILTVSAQTAASYFQYRAVYRLDRAQALITTDTKRAADLSFAAIGDLFRAIDLTPLPTLHTKHLLLAGDTMSWRLLAQAYITQTHIFTDPIGRTGAHKLMIDAAANNYRLLDRDALLCDMVAEHIRFNELPLARLRLNQLLRFTQYSADVHLTNATLCEKEGHLLTATEEAERATVLDPTFGDAYAVLGHLDAMTALLPAQSVEYCTNRARRACQRFARARQLGKTLSPRSLAEYAAMLFACGQTAQSQEIGQALSGTLEFQTLQTWRQRLAPHPVILTP